MSLSVAWTINSLAYSIVYPFIPIYLHAERGIPIETVGMIFPLMGLAVILTPPLAGILTDKIGRHFMLQAGQTFRMAIFLILAVFAHFQAPFWVFALMLMINAGVGTFFTVASDSYLSDITRPEERPKLYSWVRIGTNIGWALGPMLGAFLARTPFSLMFAITSILCLCGAFWTNRYCREVPEQERVVHPENKPAEELTVKRMLGDRMLVKILVCSFLLFLLVSQLYSILSVYATEVVGVSKNVLGLVYSVNGITIIFFQIPLTHLMDRLHVSCRFRLLAGAFLYACGYFLLAFCRSGWELAGAVLILTTGEVLTQPSLYTAVSSRAPKGGIGRYMASLGLIRGVGFAAGPWFGAIVFKHYSGNPPILWGILASFAVLAGIGFLMLGKKNEVAGH